MDFNNLTIRQNALHADVTNFFTSTYDGTADDLCSSHNEFYTNLSSHSILTKPASVDNITPYSTWLSKASDSFLNPIKEMHNLIRKHNLKRFLKTFLLHGSLATLDYVEGFSDVDTLIVIKKSTMDNPQKMEELKSLIEPIQSLFYHIDPLQHHGVFVVTEQEMGFYPQYFFPTEALKYSVDLMDSDLPLRFRTRNDSLEKKNIFYKNVSYFAKVHTKEVSLRDIWQWKLFYSKLLLLPTLYLQARGTHVYKRESFDLIKDTFSKRWRVIDTASATRRGWKCPGYINPIIRLLQNPKQIRALMALHKYEPKHSAKLKYDAFLLAYSMVKKIDWMSKYKRLHVCG